jgi:hypothetical protein
VAVPRPIAFLVMPRVFNASPLHPPFHRQIGSIPVNLERPDPGPSSVSCACSKMGGSSGSFRKARSAVKDDWFPANRSRDARATFRHPGGARCDRRHL